jgi:DNA gyrase subunit A
VMNIAVIGNNLVTLNLRQFVKVFVDHRIDVIKKRTEYDLRIATDRLHIVEGLLIAVTDIDNVIATIKASKDVKDAREMLVKTYQVSEKQASAILDMKLSKLTNLETGSLESEKKELNENIGDFTSILSDDSKVYDIVELLRKGFRQGGPDNRHRNNNHNNKQQLYEKDSDKCIQVAGQGRQGRNIDTVEGRRLCETDGLLHAEGLSAHNIKPGKGVLAQGVHGAGGGKIRRRKGCDQPG